MSVISEVIGRVLRVRSMVAADLPRLLQIEKQPFGSRLIRHALPSKLAAGDRGIWVATIQNAVVGYLIYQVFTDRESSAEENPKHMPGASVHNEFTSQQPRVELLHVFVAPTWRRQGIGKALLERFEPFPNTKEEYYVQAVVPESELPVQLMLRKAGFKANRVLRRYFVDEDAYMFQQARQ